MKLNISGLFKKDENTASNKNKTVVFYGMPAHTKDSMEKYISIAGEPVAFTGSSEEVEKYKNKLYLGKYKVYSLNEILKMYPENEIWVTYKRANATAKTLLKKYSPEKIHFFEADLEYKKSCDFMGHFIDYRVDNLSPCCVGKKAIEKTKGSVAERIAHW